MLIEFTVGNYRSFKEPMTLSMVASKLVSKDKALDENTTFESSNGLRLLTSAAIYGANASGKSNLVSAMGFMRLFVLGSTEGTRSTGQIRVDPFRLSSDTQDQASHFEIVFLFAGHQYRYGFEVTRERVQREWLYHVPKERETRLFEREGDTISLSSSFKEGRGLETKTRPNALFLSVVAQFNGEKAGNIRNWFLDLDIISGLDDFLLRDMTLSLWGDAEGFAQVTDFIKGLDLSIEDLSLELDEQRIKRYQSEFNEKFVPGKDTYLSGQYRVKTKHSVYDEKGAPASSALLDLDEHESEGTRKLLALSGPLLGALATGTVMVADEFDARLHPMVTQRLIELFNSADSNRRGAQLIFTTQDTNLLDHRRFRRDQIWFTEKDRQGATHLYSLAEFQSVRNDASFEKDYILGRYGAIPYLGDLSRLVEKSHDQTAD